jgi:hypothetical protein
MLRFQDPLTPAAREILVYCLAVAADEMIDLYEDDEAWAAASPLSSACFTRELARKVLLDLLDKLDAPELYVPMDYHWLLMYECLKEHITIFNDEPVPSVVQRLRALANEQDAAYLHLLKRPRDTAGLWIGFDEFIDVYFWDTDFLTDAGMFAELSPEAKQQLEFNREAFGVIQRLRPHPDELILKRWEVGGSGDTQDRAGSDKG